jgi:hypothetical protein
MHPIEENMMFLTLGQTCAHLENPAFVDALTRAFDVPGGDQTRARLLSLHATLGLILADPLTPKH